MRRPIRFALGAPLAVALILALAPTAQAGNSEVCRAARAGHTAFTDDYRHFIAAFTAGNTDRAEQWTVFMRDSLSRWRSRVRHASGSTPAGRRARRAVLRMIARSRDGVVLFIDAVAFQRADLREQALDSFTAGQQELAEAAERALPRLRAIGCGR